MTTTCTGKKVRQKNMKKARASQPVKKTENKIWKWWNSKRSKNPINGRKWKTLAHNGPIFAPEYQRVPKNVKFYYDGAEMTLSKDAEEVAGFYGKMLKDRYTKKKIFNENFFKDWREVMEPRERLLITDFRKCNFEDFYDYYKLKAERAKHISNLEKQRIKMEREEILSIYGFCLVDGHKQRITNFRMEPPGLFRGRGNHPKMGRLKRRVEPEDVTINIGKDAPVPQPPTGHKWKEVIHDNTVTWLARWTENISGKIKYVMLNSSSELKGQSDILKYETARRLKQHLRDLRVRYMEDLRSSDLQIKQRAVALYFIDELALRMGNEKDEDSADTVGCCSLRVEHIGLDVAFNGEKFVVHFDFPGKDSIRYKKSVAVDKRVFKNLQQFLKAKPRGCLLFDCLTPAVLNKYLSEVMEGLTAKVFRTCHASNELERQLDMLTRGTMSLDEKLMIYNMANKSAAVLCNHHKAVPKTYAKSMKNIDKKMQDKMHQVKELIKEMQNSKKGFGEELNETEPTSSEMKKISMLRKQIEKLQLQASTKEENKDIALATSKLNYLDPRITVAWCKKWEVPIEKVYSKTQRERFQWAIETTDSNFKF